MASIKVPSVYKILKVYNFQIENFSVAIPHALNTPVCDGAAPIIS